MRKLTVFLLVGLLFVACGGDNESSDSTPTTSGSKHITAFLTRVDATEGELTYDEVEFLTGDKVTNPDSEFEISNPDKTTKTIAIAPNAQVTLNILAVDNSSSESQGASVLELADAFVKGKTTPDGRDRSEFVASRPFTLTLSPDGDAVTKIDEIYTP